MAVDPQSIDGTVCFGFCQRLGTKCGVGQPFPLQDVDKVNCAQLLPTSQLLQRGNLRRERLPRALPCRKSPLYTSKIAVRHFLHIKAHEQKL